MTESSTKTLDHIVHLTPPGTVDEASARFRALGFTVIPGGSHADGLTANALVILSDEAYLELISFTHEPSYYPPGSKERKARDTHFFASKKPGWADYGFLGNGSKVEGSRISDIVNRRAEQAKVEDFRFEKEVEGGRVRPDGKALKWLITLTQNKRTIPFFCGDITPRAWRVPLQPPNTQHPSSAQGIAHVRVLTNRPAFARNIQHLTAVVGSQPINVTDSQVVWQLDSVRPIASSSLSTSPDDIGISHDRRPKLILALPAPGDQEEGDYLAELREEDGGIFEIAFWVERGKQEEGSEKTPYGRVRWIYS